MTDRFQPNHERLLIERFAATTTNAIGTRSHLTTFCSSFRLALPDQTPLAYTGRTDWIPSWRTHAAEQCTTSTLYNRLTSFARLARWLFHEGIIEDDAFAHVRVWQTLQGEEAPLWLRYNLQRVVERYLPISCGTFSAGRRATVRSTLLDFNAFLNRSLSEAPPPKPGTLSIDVPLVTAWLGHRRTRVQARTVVEEGGHLHRFLEFASQEGAITDHAFTDLLGDHGRRGYQGVIEALLSADPRRALLSVCSEPQFASALADSFQAFAAYKRSLGQDFRVQETIFADLDRYLRKRPPLEQHLSASVLEGWMATTPSIGPNARRRRLLFVRQFCKWMALSEPSFFVPNLLDLPRRLPARQPFIYTVSQIQTLLDTASKLTPVGSLRPRTYRCLIGLLYGAGLRISEALALNVGDFDSGQQLLLIRETKFHKSRYVPLTPSVSASVDDYLRIRREAGNALPPEASIFVNERGRRCAYQSASRAFLTLARRCGLRGPPGQPGPRIHDLRHAHAVHCLTRWYEEGVDVQAKLPLLSTYLGHSSIAATQVYLTITADLLRLGAARFHRARRLSPTTEEVADES